MAEIFEMYKKSIMLFLKIQAMQELYNAHFAIFCVLISTMIPCYMYVYVQLDSFMYTIHAMVYTERTISLTSLILSFGHKIL